MNSTTQALERCRDGFIAERATGQPCLDDWREETLRMIEAALSQRTDPWRHAVDEALIAHALDCTGPGDDPKEKVKELIEWAVTIATDPRVSETAAREQEASATGAEPTDDELHQAAMGAIGYMPVPVGNSLKLMRAAIALSRATPTTSTTGKVDASRVRALSEYEIDKWWASENGLEDHDMCKLKDFREVVRAVEKKLGIGTPKSAEGEGA